MVSLIGFHDFALTTERRQVAIAHCFANAVGHEPRRFVSDVEGAVELVSGDAFLRRGHQVKRLQPLVKRDMRAL